MEIYPSIDILDGACVRLYQGRYDQVTTYGNTPAEVAKRYADAGATHLHVVDLSGAQDPKKRQLDAIAALAKDQRLSVQVGGGLRTEEDVHALLDLGVDRAVLGSVAVKDPDTTPQIVASVGPKHITLAVDVRKGEQDFQVATHGWTETESLTAWDLIESYRSDGLIHVLSTDIGKDGTLQGPNLALYQELTRRFSALKIQASGGMSALSDLQALKPTGVSGVIIGKALLDGRFTLEDALTGAA